MIQSPCCSIDIIAHNSFETDIPYIGKNNNTESRVDNNVSTDNTLTHNQLFSENTTRQSLSFQFLRQLAYSNTLLHMVQSANLY